MARFSRSRQLSVPQMDKVELRTQNASAPVREDETWQST